MNVRVKPLVWEPIGGGHSARSPFGVVDVRAWDIGPKFCFRSRGWQEDGFATIDGAKLAAERWYTAKVLDCLEPADPATVAEFLTLSAQCTGEYD